MIIEIAIDSFDLRCKVTYFNHARPDYRTLASDHEYWGGCEIDFEVLSGRSWDESGRVKNLTAEFAQAVGTMNEEAIKHEIWVELLARSKEAA